MLGGVAQQAEADLVIGERGQQRQYRWFAGRERQDLYRAWTRHCREQHAKGVLRLNRAGVCHDFASSHLVEDYTGRADLRPSIQPAGTRSGFELFQEGKDARRLGMVRLDRRIQNGTREGALSIHALDHRVALVRSYGHQSFRDQHLAGVEANSLHAVERLQHEHTRPRGTDEHDLDLGEHRVCQGSELTRPGAADGLEALVPIHAVSRLPGFVRPQTV